MERVMKIVMKVSHMQEENDVHFVTLEERRLQ